MSDKKRVFITGASAGFGFDTVKALAARGHTVFAAMRDVSGRNAAKATELESWATANHHAVHVVEVDVTNDASVAKGIATAVDRGGLDVIINNAGAGTWGIDEGFSIDQARQIFELNLLGVMRVNRAAVPHFRENGKGLILYVSSGLGRIVFPFMAIYTASKFALEGYAESTSYELAPLGIQSVIIQPGAYGTTFLANCVQPKTDVVGTYGATAKMFGAFSSGFEARAKSGGLGDPSEVVTAMVEEVERPAGDRPLRRPVGRDVGEAVTAINQTCNQIQDGLLS
ncbi:MAG: SDR family oxidoreductase, partial [Kofleriaceae bacterium]